MVNVHVHVFNCLLDLYVIRRSNMNEIICEGTAFEEDEEFIYIFENK